MKICWVQCLVSPFKWNLSKNQSNCRFVSTKNDDEWANVPVKRKWSARDWFVNILIRLNRCRIKNGTFNILYDDIFFIHFFGHINYYSENGAIIGFKRFKKIFMHMKWIRLVMLNHLITKKTLIFQFLYKVHAGFSVSDINAFEI